MKIPLQEYLLLFTLAFGPLAFGCVEPWSLAILEISLFSLLLLCSLRQASIPNTPLYKTFLPAVLAILLIGLLQLLNPVPAGSPSGFLPLTTSAYETSRALLMWSAYATLLWCAPQVLNNPASLRRFAWMVFVLGVFISVTGIMQEGQGNSAIYGLRPVYNRVPFGPYYNRDHAASMMVMSGFLGCGIFFSRLAAFKPERSMGRLFDLISTQALILFMISIIFYGIFKTGSRGGLHSFILSAFLVGFWVAGSLKTKRSVLGARMCLLLFMIACYSGFIYFYPEWIGFVQDYLDTSVLYRFSMYRSGLLILQDFPFFGTGLESLMAVFPAYQEPFLQGLVDHIHSDWLELLLQVGAIGLSLYVAGLVLLIRHALKRWQVYPSSELRCLIGGAVAAALAFSLHGLVDFSFQIPANAVLFFVIMVFLGSPTLLAAKRSDVLAVSSERMPRAGTWTLCLLSCLLIFASIRPVIASQYASLGMRSTPSERPYFLAKAIRWNPNPRYFYSMGLTYLRLAETAPEAKRIFLRQALNYSGTALDAEPLDLRFRRLYATVLWHLGRVPDAKYHLGRQRI